MNCHLRDYIFCFCCRLLHLVPNSRGFLWICSDQVSVFQELSSSDESFCSVLIAVLLSSSETLNASLDNVFRNGDFFSKCYLFGGFKPYPVRSLEGAEVSSSSWLNAKSDKGGSLARAMLFVWTSTYKISIATGSVAQMRCHPWE